MMMVVMVMMLMMMMMMMMSAPWDSMGHTWTSWVYLAPSGTSWDSLGVLGNSGTSNETLDDDEEEEEEEEDSFSPSPKAARLAPDAAKRAAGGSVPGWRRPLAPGRTPCRSDPGRAGWA